MERSISWSYGGGIQTIAILCLIFQGKLPKPDIAIMADTGRERSSTLRYLKDHALPMMEELEINFQVAKHHLATVDLYSHKGDLLLPAYTNTGKLRTWCSNEWKKHVVRRHLRSLGFGPDRPVIEWLGMSLDEIDRLKESDAEWIKTHYPLVFDVPLRRVDCETLIERVGLPLPSKSACWSCPNLNDAEWKEMKENDPDDYQAAIALDNMIREKDTMGGVYLHKSKIPLIDVEFKPNDQRMPLLECANSCWT